MAAVLRRGQGIVVFPEGTRTRDGSLGTFKKTFAILSREMDVPVVPVAIRGAFEALPRGSRLPRFRAPIRIDFLPPVLPGALSYEELTDQVRARIAARLA
jgi:long-chain acyl-CoA synthetase